MAKKKSTAKTPAFNKADVEEVINEENKDIISEIINENSKPKKVDNRTK